MFSIYFSLNTIGIIIIFIITAFAMYFSIYAFKASYLKELLSIDEAYKKSNIDFLNCVNLNFNKFVIFDNKLTGTNYLAPKCYLSSQQSASDILYSGTVDLDSCISNSDNNIRILDVSVISIYKMFSETNVSNITNISSTLQSYAHNLNLMMKPHKRINKISEIIVAKVNTVKVFAQYELFEDFSNSVMLLNEMCYDLTMNMSTLLSSFENTINSEMAAISSNLCLIGGHIYDSYFNYTASVFNSTSEYLDKFIKALNNCVSRTNEYISSVDYILKLKGLIETSNIKKEDTVILANIISDGNYFSFRKDLNCNYCYYLVSNGNSFLLSPIKNHDFNKYEYLELSNIFELKEEKVENKLTILDFPVCTSKNNIDFILQNKGVALLNYKL